MHTELEIEQKLSIINKEYACTDQKLIILNDILKKITIISRRIKYLRTYTQRAFTNKSRNSNLYSIFSKKLIMPTFKTIEPYFKIFQVCDLQISSLFWKKLEVETGLTINTCYSLWINNTKNEVIYPWPNNEIKKSTDNVDKIPADWLAYGLKYRISPFILFQNHVTRIIKNQKSKWVDKEDMLLAEAVQSCGKGKWAKISNIVRTKNPKQCMHRFRNKIENTKHGRWSPDEDERLLNAVSIFGSKKWSKISEAVLTRNDSQCRERYLNVLDPKLIKSKWKTSEDVKLKTLVDTFGEGNWAKISQQFTGRTDAQCRRRWLQIISNNYN